MCFGIIAVTSLPTPRCCERLPPAAGEAGRHGASKARLRPNVPLAGGERWHKPESVRGQDQGRDAKQHVSFVMDNPGRICKEGLMSEEEEEGEEEEKEKEKEEETREERREE
ncbi:hypothetical protein E2C01_076567 [Portunus trituberculatus]|uniref:Uncharacterized protein n=1 Tax=Portunus trituberculatus TaxID=210409 RepID=A0A5B7IIY9_PORTR|nr:hypothetical protein [Portunus trituberculatus]